ncbi:hypothetical protein [Nocardia sp. R6R-6]|uniref:hypothetical protein n=1 Tax=Nocardia sp. R6R-6 TaxID=3459303 RepID=UPI00403DAC2A
MTVLSPYDEFPVRQTGRPLSVVADTNAGFDTRTVASDGREWHGAGQTGPFLDGPVCPARAFLSVPESLMVEVL